MTTLATNDALDEIEARWKSVFGCGEVLSDIRTLIEMVRARDRVVEAARQMERSSHTSHWDRTGGSGSGCPACLREIEQYRALRETLAALDAPPAQEQEQ